MNPNLTLIVIALIAAITWFLKDITESLVVGVFIYLHPAFGKGDFIKIKGSEGRIRQIGIKYTVLETTEGDLLYIDNKTWFKENILKTVKRED